MRIEPLIIDVNIKFDSLILSTIERSADTISKIFNDALKYIKSIIDD